MAPRRTTRVTLRSWIDEVGKKAVYDALAPHEHLKVSRDMVRKWARGVARPRFARAAALVEMSRGVLTFEIIYPELRTNRSRTNANQRRDG